MIQYSVFLPAQPWELPPNTFWTKTRRVCILLGSLFCTEKHHLKSFKHETCFSLRLFSSVFLTHAVTVYFAHKCWKLHCSPSMLCCRTMKAGAGLFSALALLLLVGPVFTQRPRPRRPTRRPPTTRKPFAPKPAITQPEPQEPTDFPPVILGPPSPFPDCPRECLCSPSYPNALNCENRNIRVIPVVPSRTHYLYLQNNYISEVTAEPFRNATEVRWVNLANNRIHRIDKQVRRLPLFLLTAQKYLNTSLVL